MSMIGKTLGTFTLEAQIGKGGMGEVYRAKDQKLGRDVAINVLHPEIRGYDYTLTRKGVVDVICPPDATN